MTYLSVDDSKRVWGSKAAARWQSAQVSLGAAIGGQWQNAMGALAIAVKHFRVYTEPEGHGNPPSSFLNGLST